MGFVTDGERVRGDSGVHRGQCNPGDEDDDGADPKVVDGDQERQAGEGVYGQGCLEECCEREPVGEFCGEWCAEQHAAAEAGQYHADQWGRGAVGFQLGKQDE